jgi:hypothetical protein
MGYSARTLACSWEAADGFPPEVQSAFLGSTDPLLNKLTPVVAIPEFKVPLPGGIRASQNDIFVLARSDSGPVSIMVEGKVDETFGPTLEEWQSEASSGKEIRLNYLLQTLGLGTTPDGAIRYQLLHRAASALITAEQFRAGAAVLLIHSFSEKEPQAGWPDFTAFAKLFGVSALIGSVQLLSRATAVPLFGVWVPGNRAFLKS